MLAVKNTGQCFGAWSFIGASSGHFIIRHIQEAHPILVLMITAVEVQEHIFMWQPL